MAKLIKSKAKKSNRLKGPKRGKIEKRVKAKDKKHNGIANERSKRIGGRNNDDGDILNKSDDSIVVKKRPSKAELKSVIEALKKDVELVMVRKALKYIPHYLKSEGLTKKLLKEIIRLWAEASEKIRVVCLLCLIRIYTKLQEKEMKQLIIKKLYTSFLEKCRVTKYETMSMIGFMRHSIVELYKLDQKIASAQAQASCQQLSLTLKNASTHRNEDTYKTVLNWQFANCLILLSQLIVSLDKDSPIKSLTQQVIQLNLGAINLLTSPRYYPFYCHLIENLIHLSVSANVFIPILPFMLTILRRIQLPTKIKGENKSNDDEDNEGSDNDEEKSVQAKKSKTKEYNIDLLNHVSIEEAHSLDYSLSVIDKIYELMLLYLASQCHKIAFPELVLLPCVQLKKWINRNHTRYVQKFKVILERIKADCEKIEDTRKSVDFEFTNYSAVDAWEKKMRDSNKLSLPKLHQKHDKA